MKRVLMWLVFYCIVHAAGGDFAVKYEGMDKATVGKLIAQTYNAKFDFVNEAAYKAFVAKHKA